MRLKKTGQQVVQQELALDTYLSSLLEDISDDSTSSKGEDSQLAESQGFPEKVIQVRQKTEVDSEGKTETKLNEEIKPLLLMPGWAQKEFQALFFKVDKLTFAAPATQILRAMKFNQQPTRISGQPSWFVGLLEVKKQKIGVLDTEQLVSGKVKQNKTDYESQSIKNLLISDDGRWGLVCDEILSVTKLMPEKIRWRTLRTKRPWLIGMLIEELVSVIDVNKLLPNTDDFQQ